LRKMLFTIQCLCIASGARKKSNKEPCGPFMDTELKLVVRLFRGLLSLLYAGDSAPVVMKQSQVCVYRSPGLYRTILIADKMTQ